MPKSPIDWRTEAQTLARAPVPASRRVRMRTKLAEAAAAKGEGARWHHSMMLAFLAGAVLVMFVLRGPFAAEVQQAPEIAGANSRAPSGMLEGGGASLAFRTSACHEGPGSPRVIDPDQGRWLPSGCELFAPGVELDVAPGAEVRGDARGLQLHHGRLWVDVDPNYPRSSPFLIATPGALVRVTGTRFYLALEAGRTELWLEHGSVEVEGSGGVLREISAGHRLTWSVATEMGQSVFAVDNLREHRRPGSTALSSGMPTSKRSPSRARSPSGASIDFDALVRRVEDLRSSGKFAEAVIAIEDAWPRLSTRARRALAYERGLLIEASRGGPAACRYWRSRRAKRWASGAYAELRRGQILRLECDAPLR